MNEASESKRNYCCATRKDGQPCEAQALPGSDYCFAHDPERKEQRDAARSQGGKNRAGIVRLRGLIPPRLISVYETLEQALSEVHGGSLEPNRAQAMAAISRAMVHVLQAGELEERVRKIEQATQEDQSA